MSGPGERYGTAARPRGPRGRARDIYGRAQELGTALSDAGYPGWDARIDAIGSAGAPPEILARLRWLTTVLLELLPDLHEGLRLRIIRLQREIDAAWDVCR